MKNHIAPTDDPIVAALATLAAAGITFHEVARCPDSACQSCTRQDLPNAA